MGTTKSSNKKALIVEGGAMRGIFAAGVLDTFLDENFQPFDHFYGVSAGATNLASYLAERKGRNYTIYKSYATRPEFISLKRIVSGNVMDLDWLFRETLRDLPINYDFLDTWQKNFFVALTSINEGSAFLVEPDKNKVNETLIASCALPLAYRTPLTVSGKTVVDGGMAAAIPIKQAIDNGATQIMVIRSRPFSYVKTRSLVDHVMMFQYLKNPRVRHLIRNRPKQYNEAVNFLRTPPKGIKIIEICPEEQFSTSRLDKNASNLDSAYRMGVMIGKEAIDIWQRVTEQA